MNREDILQMAREAGMKLSPAQFSGVLEDEVDEFQLEHFATLVAAAAKAEEREACAKVCDALHYEVDAYGAQCAAAIRNRKETNAYIGRS